MYYPLWSKLFKIELVCTNKFDQLFFLDRIEREIVFYNYRVCKIINYTIKIILL